MVEEPQFTMVRLPWCFGTGKFTMVTLYHGKFTMVKCGNILPW